MQSVGPTRVVQIIINTEVGNLEELFGTCRLHIIGFAACQNQNLTHDIAIALFSEVSVNSTFVLVKCRHGDKLNTSV